jgi:hypothetical protein
VNTAQVQALAEAARVLGWHGQLRWPVVLFGAQFGVVCEASADPAAGPNGGWLVGCVRPGRDAGAVRRASLLAGYSRRAVVLPDSGDVLAALVDATVLDIGLVVDGRLLAPAGPVVASLWTQPDAARRNPHWRKLVTAVHTAPDHGPVPAVSTVDGPRGMNGRSS